MSKYARVMSAALAVLLFCGVDLARAAAVRSGPTSVAIAALTRGNAVAYDSVNKVYLVVGASGIVYGRFVKPDGTVVGAPFKIQASAIYTHFPRVAFSPDADGGAGAFLVTWSESDLPRESTSVHVRLVSYPKAGPIGNDLRIGNYPMYEAGNGVAYATRSKEFLVAWKNLGTNDIAAARVDNAGNVIAQVAMPATPDGERDPNVAYNPVTDQFLIVYSGYNNAYAFVAARRVQAGTGAVLDADRITLAQTGGTYITDVAYNSRTNQFLASWYALPGGAMFGRVLNADGSLSGNIITLSTRYKAYDALSTAYNAQTDTFLMSTHGATAEDAAVEIASSGTPIDNGFIVTAAGGTGNFYPRLAASTDDPTWLVSTANNFTSTMVQLVAGTASGAAPATPTTPTTPTTPAPPPPAPAASTPLMNVDSPGNLTTVSSAGFQVSGWAIDRGAPSGTGIDAIHVYAWPTTGAAPTFLGAATYGIARPDVGGFYGPAFAASGFSLVASGLSAGTYDIAVYAHSTLTGTFDVRLKRVNVTGPVSIPLMWIDTPAQNQNTSQNLTIAGWAIDAGSTTTSGVDTIHIYAYPSGSSTPIFLGVASVGGARPDVGAAFGATRFASSGFRLDTTALTPGAYTIVVFAHSSVTNSFNNTRTVSIRVN